eukprot:4311904-Amphidinium_carterae.1
MTPYSLVRQGSRDSKPALPSSSLLFTHMSFTLANLEIGNHRKRHAKEDPQTSMFTEQPQGQGPKEGRTPEKEALCETKLAVNAFCPHRRVIVRNHVKDDNRVCLIQCAVPDSACDQKILYNTTCLSQLDTTSFRCGHF